MKKDAGNAIPAGIVSVRRGDEVAFASKENPIRADGEEENTSFQPSKFMRARRPYLFSDSNMRLNQKLPKAVFEYHLDTLTSRKQEIEFEHFARKLAEKEICPNLIPQTGPTGGGDSKVDTETYPVSDEISIRWYVGTGSRASRERWAFAFSAKKDWQSKIKSDIEKIVSTDRDYKLIYFITNQYVSDRNRAEKEDQFTKKYGIDIRILDRTWIIECVYEHGRLELAKECLSIDGYCVDEQLELGPNDIRHEKELIQLEQQIQDPNRYIGVNYQLAEDCLRAALLARNLEYPRTEVDGRFSRAEEISKKVGHRQQELRIIYKKAWTAFWWYDDIETLNQLYDQVENLALETDQASDLGKLTNLWNLLFASNQRKPNSRIQEKLEGRTNRLKSELRRLGEDLHRPNNALEARSNLALLELTEATTLGDEIKSCLLQIRDILAESKNYPGFSVTTVIDIIQEMGDFIIDDDDFDDLFETAFEITKERTSQGQAGLILYKRGYQKLSGGKTYDAIKLLGRAQQLLALDECHGEWVSAIAGCGLAYESAGLLWAARANILLAANQIFSEFSKEGELPYLIIRLLQKMIWIEIQLGRIPQVLNWVEALHILTNFVGIEEEQRKENDLEFQNMDAVLTILLLNSKLEDLRCIGFLPEVLTNLGLESSYVILLYALGYEEFIIKHGYIETTEELTQLIINLSKQPAREEITAIPNYLIGKTVSFESVVLGCRIVIVADNHPNSILLSETMLGAIEAFLATCIDNMHVMPYREEISIRVCNEKSASNIPDVSFSTGQEREFFTISHNNDFSFSNVDFNSELHQWLLSTVIDLAFHFIIIGDSKDIKDKLLLEELSIDRALIFRNIETAANNLLGRDAKYHIEDWRPKNITNDFELLRESVWNFDELSVRQQKTILKSPMKPGKGEPPDELFGHNKMKHRDQKVFSLIDIPKWDKAKWLGIAYLGYPNSIPIMAFCFEDEVVAKQIFQGFKNRLGEIDSFERLRISIISGINTKNPADYRVVVSIRIDEEDFFDGKMIYCPSRVKEMNPSDQRHLKFFKKAYKQTGKYIVIPAYLESQESTPKFFFDYKIGKTEITFREAWEIGRHDFDVVAILEDDDPIIPKHVTNAPVLEVLEHRKRKK
jgi:hypothetical protein